MAAVNKNETPNRAPIRILPKPPPGALRITPLASQVNSIVHPFNNQQLSPSMSFKPVKIVLKKLNQYENLGEIPVTSSMSKVILTKAQVLQNEVISNSSNQVTNQPVHKMVPVRIFEDTADTSENARVPYPQNLVKITKYVKVVEKKDDEIQEIILEPRTKKSHMINIPTVLSETWKENDFMEETCSQNDEVESTETTVKIDPSQEETILHFPEETPSPDSRLIDIVTQVSKYSQISINDETTELLNEKTILNAIEELKQLDEFMEIKEHIINISMKLVESYLDNSRKTLTHFLLNDRDFSAFTGITGNAVAQLLKIPIDYNHFYKLDFFTFKDNIMLCLCKLRLNLSFSCLQVLFKLQRIQVCKDIFHNMIKFLAKNLGESIQWPVKEEILQSMPDCFIRFSSTRVVLNTLELELDEESWRSHQGPIFNEVHGSWKTLRAMLGLTPEGKVSYVGLVYPGHISEEKIFVESGMLDQLIPYEDAVMVSKGYLIDLECTLRGVKLYHPPRPGAQREYCLNDLISIYHITQSLEFVDKSLNKIRSFKILKIPFEWTLVPYINEIVLVVAGLVNLL